MASQTNYVGTGANDTSVGTNAWLSPGNITAPDSSNATNTSSPIGAQDDSIKIVKGGVISGTDQSAALNWSTAGVFRVDSFGSSASLWGLSWTASDINNGGFGAVMAAGIGTSFATETNYLEGTMLGNLFTLPAATINGIQLNINRCVTCFIGDTLISTPHGEQKIKNLQKGDLVFSFGRQGKLNINRIRNIVKSRVLNLIRLKTNSGEVVTTPSHPFHTFAGKKMASQLQLFDTVYLLKQGVLQPEIISQIDRYKKLTDIYNLTVDEDHTFFANGFAVYNKTSFLPSVDYYQITVTYSPLTDQPSLMMMGIGA